MIILDTDVLIEIFDKKSERGDEALKSILERAFPKTTKAKPVNHA
ncbi:MAG: hypothetical protein ACE5OW_06120 [Candidatus Bathyarchaeia archaeon]